MKGYIMKKHVASALFAGTLSAVLAFGLVGCGGTSSAAESAAQDTATAALEASNGTAATTTVDTSGMDLEYTDRDLDASYDAATATIITLSGDTATAAGEGVTVDGSTVIITAEGTYVVSGTFSDGQLVVAADDASKVQVVLDGVDISCSDGPAILVESGDKVFITLADGSENRVEDGTAYADTSEDAPDGCVFSASDITFNGAGSLEVVANYGDGIVSKDDLVICGGTYIVTAADDAIRGKDCVKVCDGTFDLTAAGDGIKSTNDTDATRGFVCIDGGTFTISAGDDAVHAETALFVTGGNVTVTSCYEGLEGELVEISGGTVDITASDDGVNAVESGVAAGTETMVGDIVITGGSVVLDVQGDGLDAGGAIAMGGGTVVVCGPVTDGNGSMDYGVSGTITGGTFIALGSSGMAQPFGTGSTQAEVCANVSGSAGDVVEVCDEDGNVVVSAEAREGYSMVIASSPDMVEDGEYSIYVNGSVMTTATATVGVEGMMGEGGMGAAPAGGGAVPDGAMNPGAAPGGAPAGDMGGQMPQDGAQPGQMSQVN